MSRTPEKKSGGESGPPEESSVYDFLYHDATRVGSFLAQLSPYGHLKGLEHAKSVGSVSKSTAKLEGGVEVPLIVKVGAGGEHEASEDEQESLSRTYDPFWTNALHLYEKLDAAALVKRDIAKASLGQFVLVTGTFAIIDLKIVQGAWKIPNIRKLVGQGEPDYSGMTREQKATAKHEFQSNVNLMLDLLPLLPHVVQGSLRSGSNNVWVSLTEDCMVSSAAELVLRHGSVLKGQWHMLGILDATPKRDDEPTVGDGITAETIGALNAFGATAMGQIAVTLGPAIRALMGRPDHHYAMTPIMIFREVNAGP